MMSLLGLSILGIVLVIFKLFTALIGLYALYLGFLEHRYTIIRLAQDPTRKLAYMLMRIGTMCLNILAISAGIIAIVATAALGKIIMTTNLEQNQSALFAWIQQNQALFISVMVLVCIVGLYVCYLQLRGLIIIWHMLRAKRLLAQQQHENWKSFGFLLLKILLIFMIIQMIIAIIGLFTLIPAGLFMISHPAPVTITEVIVQPPVA